MKIIKFLSLGLCLSLVMACQPKTSVSEDNAVVSYSQKFEDYTQLDLQQLENYASQNDALARTQLALRYLMGVRGIQTKDPKKALTLLEQAMAQGEPEAIYQLSEFYITPSLSGIEDCNKSKILLRQAAEANHATAQMMLATRLQFGAYEHERNVEEAIYWYEKAVENGQMGAEIQLKILKEMKS